MAKSESNEKDFGNNKTSFANLPQQPTIRKWPESNTFDEAYDDTITGIEATIDHGKGKPEKFRHLEKSHKYPKASK